jgi:putative ABC transport system ATP-binding protein
MTRPDGSRPGRASAPRPAPPAGPAFTVRGLCKTYATGAGDVQALRGVDLTIERGETLVLLGPSGSGKSTLLNILGGLDAASGGSARFHDLELVGATSDTLTRYRRASVGFIFQFFNLVPSLTARENVALITEIADDPMSPEEALAMVGLGDRMDHFPTQLSGGQQQRVAVARAIAKRPELLLCDEPTGSLDSESGVQVLEAIATVARDVGATTMIVSHNAGIAAMADRVIRFRDGRITDVAANRHKVEPREMAW